MKNYNQMAENVFRRRDEYLKAKAKKKPLIISVISISLCFLLVSLIGGGAWLNRYLNGINTSDIAQNSSNQASKKPMSSNPSKAVKPSSEKAHSSDEKKSNYNDTTSIDYYNDDYYYEDDDYYNDTPDEDDITIITSIDKLNYYTGKMLATNDKALMSNGYAPPKPITLFAPCGLPKATAMAESKSYYPLKRDTVFTVKSAIYFKAEITVESGFLASKLGTGVAEVVMTVNNIDTMITFKLGDNYYSCLNNAGHNDEEGWYSIQFSSHKYIDGYYVVKTVGQGNATFDIYVDGTEIVKVLCNYNSADPYNDPLTADAIIPIPSSAKFSKGSSRSFTIARLETAIKSYQYFE